MRIFKKNENDYTHFREMPKSNDDGGGIKMMPVLDVRDGEKMRIKVNQIVKQLNIEKGSKFIKPSYSGWGYSYNLSMKK